MKQLGLVLGVILCTIIFKSCSERNNFSSGEWIDLTHDFSSETVYWPTADLFKLEEVYRGYTERGYYYFSNNYSAAEHGGTHIDAPIHFAEGKNSVDLIPLTNLIAPAVVVDVSNKTMRNRDYQIGVVDFKDWEAQHGITVDGMIVLLNTGYDKFWFDLEKYTGTVKRGEDAVSELHFPGLDPQAAQWLVEERNIKAIGLDTPSIDYGQSVLFESHQILFSKNIPVFENVSNIDKLPSTGSFVIALPMKIKGGSGSPLRIVAFVQD